MTRNEILNKLCEIRFDIDNISEDLYSLIYNTEHNYKEKEMIYDINQFIRALQIENLYTKELQDFIDNYRKFHNKYEE